MGEQGDRKQGEGEQGKGGQAQSNQESAGESQGRPSASDKSAEAAEAMRKEAERQASALGIPDGQGEEQGQSEESSPSEQQGEPNSGEPNSGESKSGEGKGTMESHGGGGLLAEIARLMREQASKADPAALSRILESQGWFRIKGAAKDGLGDGNLKDVPAEYRELVRAYFLRLSEEK